MRQIILFLVLLSYHLEFAVDVAFAADTKHQAKVLEAHRASVMALAFAPDGKTFASSSRDQTIKIWDAETFEVKRTLEGHGSEVACVVFSPRGDLLASGG